MNKSILGHFIKHHELLITQIVASHGIVTQHISFNVSDAIHILQRIHNVYVDEFEHDLHITPGHWRTQNIEEYPRSV
jgi:hypothetical protein